MTDEEATDWFKNKLAELENGNYELHEQADNVLVEFLLTNGFAEVAKSYAALRENARHDQAWYYV